MSDPQVFETLASLIRPYAAGHRVKTDAPDNFYLERDRPGPPEMFAAVQAKKSYVSLHLFPVYLDPTLLDGISPELRKRMQGKSCFNFARVEQIPVDELTTLIARAAEAGQA